MPNLLGSNLRDVRMRNRALILKLVATKRMISRADLSRRMGLTKTTAGIVVSDLIDEGIICETQIDSAEITMGRKPIYLDISPNSPCVCGMLIKRGLLSVIFADYKGTILVRRDHEYSRDISSAKLVDTLLELYDKLKSTWERKIIAVGISAIGPVDIVKQQLANPPNFHGISNLPLPKIISDETGLPAFIIHDAGAGALAEKIYGKAEDYQNFIYIHMIEGIGAGYILNNKVYNGVSGKSGEIGHTSINFSGPLCYCGNNGCLEMYANVETLNAKIRHLRKIYPAHTVLADKANYSWREIIDAADMSDFLAISALDEFCGYVAQALANAVNLFDIDRIIIGYDSSPNDAVIANILSEMLNSNERSANYRKITIEKSTFCGDAPLIGSVALITDRLFNGDWEF